MKSSLLTYVVSCFFSFHFTCGSDQGVLFLGGIVCVCLAIIDPT